MVEKQANHRQQLEKEAVRAEIRRGYLGMVSGFFVALTGLGIGGFLIYHEKLIEGSAFAGSTLAALVGVFIYGATMRRHEREAKTQILAGK